MSSFADITIGKRYARALFEALEPTSYRSTLAQLQKLSHAATQVAGALAHPALASRQKAQLLWEALKQAEPSASPQLEGLLLVLAENKRISMIAAVVTCFEGIVEAFEKLTRVKVVSAYLLPADEQEQVSQKVRTSFLALQQKGIIPTVEFSVDPSLLGGLKMTLADKELDASLAGAFERLQVALQG
jgi:F-type H+-transporting ATPase subunit delta